MAMADIGPTYWPMCPTQDQQNLGNILLDEANESVGFLFRAPKTCTVRRVHFLTGTVTTGATIDVRIESVSASGLPSGSLFGTNTNVSHVLADTDDNLWIRTNALTSDASLTINDEVAVVIKNPGASFGNFNVRIVNAGAAYGGRDRGTPYVASGGGKSILGILPLCALELSDGSIVVPDGFFPAKVSDFVTLNTSNNPDEAGLYFTPNVKMRVCGWWGWIGGSGSQNYRISLYASGNNTPLLTKDYDQDFIEIQTTMMCDARFDSTYTLAAGTTYRLAVQSLGTQDMYLRYWEVDSAYPGILAGTPGGSTSYYTSRNRSGTTDPDAAAWTEVNYRRPQIGLMIDQVDDGTGGGSVSYVIGG